MGLPSTTLADGYVIFLSPHHSYLSVRQPIPLDLLTLATFTDPPTQRGTGLLRGLRGGGAEKHGDMSYTGGQAAPESAGDSRAVYPCTIHHNGRVGGLYTLYAESAASRAEWKQRLEEAIGLRKIVQESNKVFEIETLSSDTFLIPSVMAGPSAPTWNNDNTFTGKVTCSIPFSTSLALPISSSRLKYFFRHRRWAASYGYRLCRGCMDRIPARL